MTTNRVKQILLGSELTDAELEDIPSARMELHTHVLTKFVQVSNQITKIVRNVSQPQMLLQVSSILGAGIIGPLVGLKRGRSLAAAFRAVPAVRIPMLWVRTCS